ncbi:MAG: hypothetical protein B5M54_09060 [Candidatus Aminicenantes bacterium 4484_214]|nr:MAG: hypothetical protein B5M54_09060 [Candidatus Aminicenantes bacterium 4484_214]
MTEKANSPERQPNFNFHFLASLLLRTVTLSGPIYLSFIIKFVPAVMFSKVLLLVTPLLGLSEIYLTWPLGF